jgi:hypothetical protein
MTIATGFWTMVVSAKTGTNELVIQEPKAPKDGGVVRRAPKRASNPSGEIVKARPCRKMKCATQKTMIATGSSITLREPAPYKGRQVRVQQALGVVSKESRCAKHRPLLRRSAMASMTIATVRSTISLISVRRVPILWRQGPCKDGVWRCENNQKVCKSANAPIHGDLQRDR